MLLNLLDVFKISFFATVIWTLYIYTVAIGLFEMQDVFLKSKDFSIFDWLALQY